ncbi:MAG: RNA polymerase sigma factor [Anaeroplasmataceae bacterium]
MDLNRINELFLYLKNNELSYFDEFYNMTNQYIFYNIVKIVDSFEDAEDILQDTYIYFLNKINTISKNSSPVGYLLLTAKHKAIDFLRKQKRVVFSEDYINYNYHVDFNPNDNSLIKALKEKLEKEDLEIIILHVIDGLTFKEISKLKDKPLGTILWKYNKIIKDLREELNYEDFR